MVEPGPITDDFQQEFNYKSLIVEIQIHEDVEILSVISTKSIPIIPVTQKTLGYCRFPLYIPQKIGNLDTWEVTFGPVKRALHPGVPILSIDMIPDIPQVFVAGYEN
ncbi:unnamed protein product [Rotaria sp. Silwood1]|nr:unnamed protein product [Rotaria sp. Silwood1]